MFDIKSLSIQESHKLNITHPATGEKLYIDSDDKLTLTKEDKDGKANRAVVVTVASTANRAYREAVNAMQNRTLKLKGKARTPEQSREEGLELLVACCLSAENLYYDGGWVKSENDFRALLSDDSMSWIKQQIDEALGNVENFIV